MDSFAIDSNIPSKSSIERRPTPTNTRPQQCLAANTPLQAEYPRAALLEEKPKFLAKVFPQMNHSSHILPRMRPSNLLSILPNRPSSMSISANNCHICLSPPALMPSRQPLPPVVVPCPFRFSVSRTTFELF
jgi:hypothetical protein